MTTYIHATGAGRREWAGLAVLALPTLLLALDLSVLHLAAPRMSAELKPDSTQLLWILDIYGFMIAGFLMTMGTLGDRIGRRRLLMAGAGAFAAASVAAAYATSPGMLIATRALLGVAGATLMPSTLALISTMFRDSRQRAVAVGVWMTCFMVGSAVGPVVGGLLLERFWWGSVFLLGVPVMALLLISAPMLLPEHRDPGAGRVDPLSVALSLGAVIGVVYGLKELAAHGLRPSALAVLAGGVLLGLAFVRRQRVLTQPVIDLRLFAERAFTGTLLIMLVTVLTAGGTMLFAVQYLQMVRGLSALDAGLWLLPAMGATIAGSMVSPLLARRVPPGRLVGGGLALAVLGHAMVAAAGGTGGFGLTIGGVALAFLGVSPTMVLGTDLVLGSAPAEKAGSASSLSETAGELGSALGIALLGSVGAAVYRARMEGRASDSPAAEDSLPGALAADGLPAGVVATARDAFTSGMSVAAMVAAAVSAALAVAALRILRHVPALGGPGHENDVPADDHGTGPHGDDVPAHDHGTGPHEDDVPEIGSASGQGRP